MGIQRSQEDSWTKEMAKWEMRPVLVGGTYIEPIPFAQGGRAGAPHQEYPKAMYRAEMADGGPRISDYKTVPDAWQEDVAKGQGWHARQEDAIQAVHDRLRELATIAANRAAQDKWMSPHAQAEAAAADESTMQHLGEIPETPIRRMQPKEPTSPAGKPAKG